MVSSSLCSTSAIENQGEWPIENCSEGNFDVYRPMWATHCTDLGKIWRKAIDSWWGGTPKTENRTQYQNINTPGGHMPCVIFMKFATSAQCFIVSQLLNFEVMEDSPPPVRVHFSNF